MGNQSGSGQLDEDQGGANKRSKKQVSADSTKAQSKQTDQVEIDSTNNKNVDSKIDLRENPPDVVDATLSTASTRNDSSKGSVSNIAPGLSLLTPGRANLNITPFPPVQGPVDVNEASTKQPRGDARKISGESLSPNRVEKAAAVEKKDVEIVGKRRGSAADDERLAERAFRMGRFNWSSMSSDKMLYEMRSFDQVKASSGRGQAGQWNASKSFDASHAYQFTQSDSSLLPTSKMQSASGETIIHSATNPDEMSLMDGIRQRAEKPAKKIEELTDEEIKLIPADSEGLKTSLGSVLHSTGQCRPCVFNGNSKKGGCTNGMACTFCHFNHRKKIRPHRLSRKERLYKRTHQSWESSGGSEGIERASPFETMTVIRPPQYNFMAGSPNSAFPQAGGNFRSPGPDNPNAGQFLLSLVQGKPAPHLFQDILRGSQVSSSTESTNQEASPSPVLWVLSGGNSGSVGDGTTTGFQDGPFYPHSGPWLQEGAPPSNFLGAQPQRRRFSDIPPPPNIPPQQERPPLFNLQQRRRLSSVDVPPPPRDIPRPFNATPFNAPQVNATPFNFFAGSTGSRRHSSVDVPAPPLPRTVATATP